MALLLTTLTGKVLQSVVSVSPFSFYLLNRPTFDLDFLHVSTGHKTLNNYREKEKEEKQTNQSFTAFSHIRGDIGLHLTV